MKTNKRKKRLTDVAKKINKNDTNTNFISSTMKRNRKITNNT